MKRKNHEKILELELKKLENRFFNLFQIEKKEMAAKHQQELDSMDVRQ